MGFSVDVTCIRDVIIDDVCITFALYGKRRLVGIYSAIHVFLSFNIERDQKPDMHSCSRLL